MVKNTKAMFTIIAEMKNIKFLGITFKDTVVIPRIRAWNVTKLMTSSLVLIRSGKRLKIINAVPKM